MYAIVELGAKQYNVKEGDSLDVEKQLVEEGEEFTLDKILLVCKDDTVEVGNPYLKDIVVKALVLKHLKDKKVISFKYRRRKSSHWTKGHRQQLTRIKISKIAI